MSLFAALTTVLLLSGSVVALDVIQYAVCTDYAPWTWAYNSLDQNPCLVAAYMQSTCWGGSFTVSPLPEGYQYAGPSISSADDWCKCNTVTYSLISACAGCQEGDWISWTEWSANCTTVMTPSTFPNPVPSGTSVPRWALRDITLDPGTRWDGNASKLVGDTPEAGPGVWLSASNSSAGSPTTAGSSPSSPPTSTPDDVAAAKRSRKKKLRIFLSAAAGVVAIVFALGLYICMRMSGSRSKKRSAPPLVIGNDGAPQQQPPYGPSGPLLGGGGSYAPSLSTPQTPIPPMSVYSPNPNYSRPPSMYHDAPSPLSPDASAPPPPFTPYPTANIPPPEPREYRGMPMPTV